MGRGRAELSCGAVVMGLQPCTGSSGAQRPLVMSYCEGRRWPLYHPLPRLLGIRRRLAQGGGGLAQHGSFGLEQWPGSLCCEHQLVRKEHRGLQQGW